MTPRVAVFVDGDNIVASYAPDILKIAKRLGTVEVARAYGDATRGSGWHEATGYHLVHSGGRKNATDLLPCKVGPAGAAPSKLDLRIRTIIAANSKNGQGMRLVELAPKVFQETGQRIRTLAENGWRGYFEARTALYEIDPSFAQAKVRFKPVGFTSVT
jgi:hypothetical protein